MKLFGSLLIMIGCAACGISCAIALKNEIKLLRMLNSCLDHISAQLEFKLLPLPALLASAASLNTGKVSDVLRQLSIELDNQSCPDVKSCMSVVLERYCKLPPSFHECMVSLSYSLGKFDASGQLQGLLYTREMIKDKIAYLESDQNNKTKLYKTFGICVGLSLVIILL